MPKYKDRFFNNEYQILYDTIRDHDVYNYLKVSLEVDRGMDNVAVVWLNGKPIGAITIIDHKYKALRKDTMGEFAIVTARTDTHDEVMRGTYLGRLFDTVGQATAAIISDYV
jgi:hypothetical protein